MKLFHFPPSCSLGIRVLLEEIGAPYETITVSLAEGAHRSPEYLALNPKGKVPALVRPDGSVLTEYPVISLWLARNFPQAGLLPEGDGEYRALELVEYIVSTLHMRGTTLIFRSDRFVPQPEAQEAIRSHAREVLREGFALLEERLGGRDWFFERFSIADAAAFYLLVWDKRAGVELPPGLAAFRARMLERPAVQRAMA